MSASPKHHKAIVDAAVTLFRRKGYSGTGLADLVSLSGAPRGSLYHFFPDGKTSIAEAAVREAGQRVFATIEGLAKDAGSTGELLCEHAKLLAGWMEKSGYRDGCPITTVLLEMAPDDALITEAGREAYSARVRALSARLVIDGFSPERAYRLAILSSAALQGALIQARVERSGAPIVIAAEELAEMFAHEALAIRET